MKDFDRRARRLMWLLTLAVGCGGQQEGNDAEADVAQAARAVTSAASAGPAVELRRLTATLPAGVDFKQVAVAGAEGLTISDRAQITTPAGGFGATSNAGTSASVYGVAARVGDITSRPAVTLGDRSAVNGSVTSGGRVTRGSGSTVSEAVSENAPLTPLRTISWDVEFALSGNAQTAGANQTLSLAPGAYGNVTAQPNGKLALRTGTYFLEGLDLEPQSSLSIDSSAGPVFVYVRSSLIVRGNLPSSSAANLLLGYLGSQAVAIEAPFAGSFVAPNAAVRFGVGGTPHTGSVFAKSVLLDPDVKLSYVPFARWDALRFNVEPSLLCVEHRADGSFAAVLGYSNPNSAPVQLPLGPGNTFAPPPQSHGQPTSFLPGAFASAFSVDFGSASSLTWNLNGTALAIPRSASACPASLAYSGTQDTTVVAAAASANFGSNNRLTLGTGNQVLVQFDRAQIKRELGAGRFVSKAVLEFSAAAGAQPAADAFVMHTPWSEGGATWNCANDTNPSASGESCASDSAWNMVRDDATEHNPWLKRGPAHPVHGSWASGKLSFDVTRDVWELLGKRGIRAGLGWAVLAAPGASGSASLFSREGSPAPRLVLTTTTRPEVDPAGSTPLAFSVDSSARPQRPDAGAASDGVVRTLATVRDPHGHNSDFVERELVFRVQSPSELSAIVTRWNAKVLSQTPPPAAYPSLGTQVVVRIDPTRAQTDALVPRLLEIDNRPRGAHAVTTASALATLAAGAEAALAGQRVGLNFAVDVDAPSLSDWASGTITDGPDETGSTPALGSNAFSWPGYATCNPDPGDPNIPPRCLQTLPGGSPLFQFFSVAEAWSALALSNRLVPNSVPVIIPDGGFTPDTDLAPSTALLGTPRDAPRVPDHGHSMSLNGHGQVGNGIGAAGPGGPVSSLGLVFMDFTASGMFDAILLTMPAKVASMSWSVDTCAVCSLVQDYDLLTSLVSQNTVLFAAAGNEGRDVDAEDCFIACWEETEFQPCENTGVNCVGGLDFNSGTKAPDSNFGSDGAIDIAGPWFGLEHSRSSDGFVFTEGTSPATAFLGGIGALISAAKPSAGPDEIEHCLYAGAHDVGWASAPDALESVRCMIGGNVHSDIPPVIHIDLPTSGASVARGAPTSVNATASDGDSGLLGVHWASNIDGPLGSSDPGQNGFVVFRSAGTHQLTASATGDGVTVQQTITVNVVNVAPSVAITQPAADGQHFPAGTSVPFVATGSGFPVPNCSEFVWSSVDSGGNIDFSGVTGCTVRSVFNTLGDHSITVRRTDSQTGLSSSATRVISVDATTAAIVEIVSPTLGPAGEVEVLQDANLTLTASANFPVADYEWSIWIDGARHFIARTASPSVTWKPDTLLGHSCWAIDGILQVDAHGVDPNQLDADGLGMFFVPSPEINAQLGCVR